MPITIATAGDLPALLALVNNAYRGEESKKGWATEAGLIAGDIRTDKASLQELMQTPAAVFLKYSNEQNVMEGCVFLQVKEKRLYLGLLSVSPARQAKGIGRQLMIAAENYAKAKNCSSIYMQVVSARDNLIAWYERQGYHSTGETAPFPTDGRFGIPLQPLEFIILEKKIK